MSDYDNTNRGALFKNTEKESDKHPDYKGNLNVGGKEFYLAAWLKTSKKGQKYMSVAVTPAGEKSMRKPNPKEMDSEIPF